jgi:cellulose synthase/poly-beta-1,6-N-acetylglucosamine synthase-like glycosyltransferase
VLVVSNGSTDRTNEIVRSYDDARVRLIALEQPGKMGALNEGARSATGEVLIFTDADFLLDTHSLKVIARKFGDREVGGVCGARKPGVKREGDATGEGEGLYGRWDKWQKVRESEIGSVFAADGLLYAIRRELYKPITDPAQADDIAISVPVVLQGYRLLFDPNATAWENASVVAGEEFRRKVRVTNHSVLSHKLVRHFIPFFLIPLLISNAILAAYQPLYLVTLIPQLLIYALAIGGALTRDSALGRSKPLYIPYFFCFVNAAAFFGILSIMRGQKQSSWSSRPSAA